MVEGEKLNLQDSIVAGRYARALFEAARAAKAADAVRADLGDLAKAVRLDTSLAAALTHPGVPPAEKKARLEKAAGRKLHVLTGRFLDLLLTKKRVALLPAMAALFDVRADEGDGLSRAQVRAARPLTEEQSKILSSALERALGTKVSLETSVDETLLGGVVVRAGDRLWDLSLRGRLARLKEKLLETATH